MQYKNYTNFVKNKYFNTYSRIIDRAISENRIYNSDIHEYHHPMPKCLGGVDIVILTFKEHYICHWLLTKFTKGQDRHKMIMAMSFFYYLKINTSAKRPLHAIKSTTYSNYKTAFIQAQKDRFLDPAVNPFYKHDIFCFKNIKTGDTKEYTRFEAAKYTDMQPNEVSRLISRGYNSHKNTSSKGWSIWIDQLGLFSHEIEKIKNIEHRKILVECQYCKKEIDKANHTKWHGDNCKFKVLNPSSQVLEV
jgi:hypothetical protein